MEDSIKEQTKLETFFQHLGSFRYEKAKELLDNEKSHLKNYVGSAKQLLYVCLYSLLQAEKGYMSLQFLTSKPIFSKKENVRGGYLNVINDLHKVESVSEKETSSTAESEEFTLAVIIPHLIKLAKLRGRLIDFYDSILCLPQKVSSSFKDLFETLDDIVSITECEDFHQYVIVGWTNSIKNECRVLQNLLIGHDLISNMFFLKPLVLIHEANNILNDMSGGQASEVRLFSRGSTQPPLLSWLGKLKAFLTSKYSLYFFEVLAKQAPSLDEVKTLASRDSPDLVARLSRFQRQTNARSVALIFDTKQDWGPYLGHGYFLPGLQGEAPTGVNSFPVVFKCPLDQVIPSRDLSAVVIQISGNLNMGSTSEWQRTIYAHDDKLDKTYFVRKMESRVFMVIIFEGNKPQKDKQVERFLQECANILRGFDVINLLKNG